MANGTASTGDDDHPTWWVDGTSKITKYQDDKITFRSSIFAKAIARATSRRDWLPTWRVMALTVKRGSRLGEPDTD